MAMSNLEMLRIGAQAEHDREQESLKELVRQAYRGKERGAAGFAKLITEGPDEKLQELLAENPGVIPLIRRLASFGWWTVALATINDQGRIIEADGAVIPNLKERKDARQRENSDWSDDDREIE